MGTTNTLDLNNRVTELEKAVSGGDSSQANKADIATEFNTTTAYTAGCFVYYGGKLYQFNADHAAGAWDPTDVVEANVTDQVVSNKAAIDELAESYPADKVMMSDGVTSVEDALDGLNANNLSGRVDITAYTTSKYVAPSDGYLYLIAGSTSSTYISAEVYGSNEGNKIITTATFNNSNTYNSLYVKKGMKILIIANNNGGAAYFVPLS